MTVRELIHLLTEEDDLDAEVMVGVSAELRRDADSGVRLALPTRDVERGEFFRHASNGQPWVMIVATDAWGVSPRPLRPGREAKEK